MESEYSTLCNELDIIFFECPTDISGCAKVQNLIDAFVDKYGKDQPELRSILSDKLDPYGCNSSISRSYFKHVILEWVVVNSHADSSVTSGSDRLEVFEYETTSCAHSTPFGRYNKRFKKVPPKKLSYSPSFGFTADTVENSVMGVSSNSEELKSYRAATKTHNSSLENSLFKAEQKICSLEEKLKEVKLNSMREIERYKEENDRLRTFEKLHSESLQKNEIYEESLNNLTKEFNRLKHSKENLDKDYMNLETEYQRLKNELDSKILSLKSLETYKRVQIEESLVLQESKDILESEVLKLKTEIKCYFENQESLMNRIGELQFEKQNLQGELNELMNFEKLKIVSSSPFGKSPLFEDHFIDGTDENRESGISMRSELMDSLVGFSSCIQDTVHQPYFSIRNSADDELSLMYDGTQFNLVTVRSEKIEKGMQTEMIGERKIKKSEKGIQTKKTNEIRLERSEKEVQTNKLYEIRPECYEKEVQTKTMHETRLEKVDKEIQTEEIKVIRQVEVESISICSSENETDHQFDSRCFNSREAQGNVGLNAFHWSFHAMDITLDRLTPTNVEVDSSLEELHDSMNNLLHNRWASNEERRLNSEDNGREGCFSVVNTENETSYSSSERSIQSYHLLPLLKQQNMSTPLLRVRRVESRRFSCSDIYNKPATHRPNTNQKLTFRRKISTVIDGIIYLIHLGARLCEEASYGSIIDRLLAERRSISNIW